MRREAQLAGIKPGPPSLLILLSEFLSDPVEETFYFRLGGFAEALLFFSHPPTALSAARQIACGAVGASASS